MYVIFIISEEFDNNTQKGILEMRDWNFKGHTSKQIQRTGSHILKKTETALNNFYRPFNLILAEVLKDKGFRWES